MTHTYESDTKRLVQFAKDQGFDSPYLMQAVQRLEMAFKEELNDYGIPENKFEPEYGD